MKKFFPLILALVVGLGGFFYFNQKEVTPSKVDKIYIYDYKEYKNKKPSPFIKVEKKEAIKIVVDTINSSKSTNREISIAEANYVLDVIYSKGKKEVFNLWINENTTSAMYQVKDSGDFLILSDQDTSRLKTLIFR